MTSRRPRDGIPTTPAAAALIVLNGIAVLALIACRPAVARREPTVTGVVVSRDFVTGSSVRYRLAPGAVVNVNLDAVATLAGGTPQVGDLLLYGDQPQPWLLGIAPSRDGQWFELWSQPAQSDDGRLTFDSGLRLPVAPGYRESGNGPMEPDAPVLYRLNELGEVIARA